MSWLRQEVNKAVEVAKNQNITLTVRSYADPVVQHADHAVSVSNYSLPTFTCIPFMGALNYKCYKHEIKRFEEASVSTRGLERTQLLKRLVILLNSGIETLSTYSSDDKEKTLEQQYASADVKESSSNEDLVPYYDFPYYDIPYYDFDEESEPMSFRDAFLHSQVLEGVVLSMILEPPTGEEFFLLLQMFEISLYGGREIHNALVSSIQDLAKAFSSYKEEVLVKREELLQFAQVAISGLKINVDLERIDAKASSLRQKLDDLTASLEISYQGLEELSTHAKLEALYGALVHGQICSQLKRLLRKKKILHNGDTLEVHAQKVDKLKVFEAALANFFVKAEKRISDTRFQREEASKFRVTEENEVGEIEKEGELSSTIGSFKVESDVLRTWINFLEDAWVLQCSYTEKKDKQANDELEKHKDYFVYLSISLLSRYKNELGTAIRRIRTFQNLKILREGADILLSEGDDEVPNPRKNVEEEYMDSIAKTITAFSVVDDTREHLHAQEGDFARKDDDSKLKKLRDDIERFIQEFDQSIDSPNLQSEAPETPRSENRQEIPSHMIAQAPDVAEKEHPEPTPVKMEQSEADVEVLDHESKLANSL